MGAFESGQQFLTGVLAKLPEEQRGQVETIFKSAEAKDAVTALGDATLARSDYSRSMDQLREKEQALTEYYTRLNSWYSENKGMLDAAAQQGQPFSPPAAGYGQAPGPVQAGTAIQTPGAPASRAVTPEDMRRIAEEAVNDAGRDYIALTGFMMTQGARHQHLFNEPLDMTEIVNNPKLGRPIAGQPGRVYSLQDAYQEKFGERLAKKHQEQEDARINELVEKRLAERTSAQASHPFPLRQESSPLDVLTTKEGPAAHTLDSAVAEYERLVAAKQG
jgi:hypothetical protein